jgi:hypothetical protein
VAYNLVEGGVSIAFGVEEESLSVLSFGVDSLIEVLSAMLVMCTFFGGAKACFSSPSLPR